MKYRHDYHAGNFADVMKHAALAWVLHRLGSVKPAPMVYVDSHAGSGAYDLSGTAALRTGEAAAGILRLQAIGGAPPPALEPYGAAVVPWLEAGRYPGSPALAQHFLRPVDRAILVEKHPEDAARLAAWAADDPRLHVHRRDGWEALPALLPPSHARRGCVLIDPPYEAADEPERLGRALAKACRRWAEAVWIVWYPIKDRASVWRLHEGLLGALPPMQDEGWLLAELLIRPETDQRRLNGCGLAVLNPPYGFAAAMSEALAWLQPRLADPGTRPPPPVVEPLAAISS